MSAMLAIVFAAIELSGLSGGDLRVRAYFDANNVKVGDPLVLTVDFVGEAKFSNLHPPALSKFVDRRDWKVDDYSAKTDTYRDARRLTYRVRPMRRGLLEFPSLAFRYAAFDGGSRTVRSNAIPVHAKGGVQVKVAEMDEISPGFPQPPELATAVPEQCRSADEVFAWRKACSKPTAAAFKAFDFPVAAMNEATCSIREGNWAEALKIYRRIEWLTGQTPDVEKGIIAALALKYDNPNVELPVWRGVLRPVLRYSWKVRSVIVLSVLFGLWLISFLLRRGIRAVACAAIAFMPAAVPAQGLFQQFFGGAPTVHEEIRVKASVKCSNLSPNIGEKVEFVLSLEAPRNSSVGQIRIAPSNAFGLTFLGQAENLTDAPASSPSNVVKRLLISARYDVPFQGSLSFTVDGMISGRTSRGGNGSFFSFTFSNSFSAKTEELKMNVVPPPEAGQPDDYGGLISRGLILEERCDALEVETNDVVTITYFLKFDGFVPKDFLPKDVAFEWMRRTDSSGRIGAIEYRRFFVADGAAKTPVISIPYFDSVDRKYLHKEAGGTELKYKASSD